MNFKIILFVSCVLGLVSAHRHFHGRQGNRGSYRQRHDHRWPRYNPLVQFEVQEPKGLTVSTIQRSPNVTFFGIELYVNRDPRYHSDIHCDVCKNTTSVAYGKFIIEDEEAIIKNGDVLYYYVLLGNSTNVTPPQLQRFWVSAKIIKRCNCSTATVPPPAIPNIDLRFGQTTALPELDHRPTFEVTLSAEDPHTPTDNPFDVYNQLNEAIFPLECDIDPITNQCRQSKSDLLQTNQDLGREVEILEAIIEQMKQAPCRPRTTKVLMLRLGRSNLPTKDMEQLADVVQSSLLINLEMKELVSKIKNIMPDKRSPNIVYIDMMSYVDKQKMLYHARLNHLNHVSDYDLLRF